MQKMPSVSYNGATITKQGYLLDNAHRFDSALQTVLLPRIIPMTIILKKNYYLSSIKVQWRIETFGIMMLLPLSYYKTKSGPEI